MNYQLEHVAIYTKDMAESIKYYEKFFGGHATPIRKGSAGYQYLFVAIDDASRLGFAHFYPDEQLRSSVAFLHECDRV